MLIDRVYYPVSTLGPGRRLTIWTVGCTHRCHNCSNPELWDFDYDKSIDINTILSIIQSRLPEIDGVTITGGDPFDQSVELLSLLKGIKMLGVMDCLVFTGYKYEDILKEKMKVECISFIDVLVDGEYIDEFNDNRGLRGSSNQRIIVFNHKLRERYFGYDNINRYSQNIIHQGGVFSIGIPPKYIGSNGKK